MPHQSILLPTHLPTHVGLPSRSIAQTCVKPILLLPLCHRLSWPECRQPPARSNLVSRSLSMTVMKLNIHEIEILAKLIQQLAVCTATADSLLEMLLSKEAEAITPVDLSSTLKSDSPKDCGNSAGLSRPTSISLTQPGKVNPTGPINKFVPGGLSLDGFRQHMYNGFIFDVPPHDYKGSVYLVTRGRRVGIFSLWYVLKSSGGFQSNG